MRPLSERPEVGVKLRALYTDLDGTLLGPGGTLFATSEGRSVRTAEAVALLHSAGVALVPVSGRTRIQMREAARILGAPAYIAEMGAFLVERGTPDVVLASFGSYRGKDTPFEAMGRSGAGGFLLDRYGGRLEPHGPWAFEGREATMLFRGLIDPVEANSALDTAGYRWLTLVDNGLIRRTIPTLDLPQVRAYHLVPKGPSKAAAVRAHRGRNGLEREETAAVGDSPSDLGMAMEVGTMVSVGGADGSEIGARDDRNVFVAEGTGGDGFAEAVEALLE